MSHILCIGVLTHTVTMAYSVLRGLFFLPGNSNKQSLAPLIRKGSIPTYKYHSKYIRFIYRDFVLYKRTFSWKDRHSPKLLADFIWFTPSSGHVVAWGDPEYGGIAPRDLRNVRRIEANNGPCGCSWLKMNHKLWSWKNLCYSEKYGSVD